MQNRPLVSVIIPAYNAEKYLNQALESILNQTYTNLEILIADDASTDQSKQIIDSYSDPRITRFHNEYNLGYLRTCNKLFEIAAGEYIAFQDADDWSELDRIEKTIEFLLHNPDYVLCGTNFIRSRSGSKKASDCSDYPNSDTEIKNYIQKNKSVPFCGASVIFNRDVYKSIGGYRIFFDRIGNEHFDWFLLISEKYKVANISEKLYHYRYVSTSFSRNDVIYNFRKYYISEITLFLREQRLKYSYDALQNNTFKPEFESFLSALEQKFKNDRLSVYKRLISSRLYNNDFRSAIDLYTSGIKEKEVNSSQLSVFFIKKAMKAMIKAIVK